MFYDDLTFSKTRASQHGIKQLVDEYIVAL